MRVSLGILSPSFPPERILDIVRWEHFGDSSDRHLCLRGSLYSHLEMSRMHRYLQPFYTIAVKSLWEGKAYSGRGILPAINNQK